MTYPAAMRRLVKLDPTGVRQIPLNLLPWICIGHVSMLGLIYGGTAAWLSRDLVPVQGLLKLALAGIPVAFLMHAGVSLFIWVFLKALGGNVAFLVTYFTIGVAAISLWPLAPFLAMLQISFGPAIAAGTVLTSIYALTVHIRILQNTLAIPWTKMIVAIAAAVIYISCFLYLWM